MKKILFICKWNRFRSKFAEQYFNKINKNKKFKAISFGAISANIPMMSSEIKRNKWVKKQFGIVLSEKSRGTNLKDLEEAYKIIVTADDYPLEIIKSRQRWENKAEFWNIKDGATYDKENIIKIVNILKRRTEKLVKSLENKK